MSTAFLEKQSQDGVSQYLNQIRQYPRLSAEEELALAKRCAEGDEEAISKMVSSNLRLVVSVATEYALKGAPLPDMIQEGSVGLLIAAKKFDYTLGYRFSTYATKWIRQGVLRCLNEHNQVIRLPRSASDKESLQVCSLDEPLMQSQLQELVEDLQAPQPQQELMVQELQRILEGLLSELSERQRLVLRLRFGMADAQCHSFESIAKHIGVSKERARQIYVQAVQKLQKLAEGLGLEDFLE